MAVVDMADTEPSHAAVGALTAGHRDIWCKNYQILRSSSRSELDWIESSTLLLCLDDTAPMTREEMAHTCWHGLGKNRWYDKSIQLIVCDNGRAGFLGEHSMMDATTPASFCDYIIQKYVLHAQHFVI
jgi:carnitine O-acetyltransferase